jgi:hypothetical protein
LGDKFHLRSDYRFAVPDGKYLTEYNMDATIFSSPIPSIHTAKIGFKRLEQTESPEALEKYAYLGAPVLVTLSDSELAVHHY